MGSYSYIITGVGLGYFSSSCYITSISSSIVPNNGGYKIDIFGKFPINTELLFFIGTTGSLSDYQCWSGKVDHGHSIYAINESKVRIWTPRLPVGGPYHVLCYIPSSMLSAVLEYSLSVIPQGYDSCTFDIRSLFSNRFFVGPKRIDLVTPIV